jgi:hypothetical protein
MKEWRVIVWWQDDPRSNWEVIADKSFYTEEEAKKFKSTYDTLWVKAYLYHYEPSWVPIEED